MMGLSRRLYFRERGGYMIEILGREKYCKGYPQMWDFTRTVIPKYITCKVIYPKNYQYDETLK